MSQQTSTITLQQLWNKVESDRPGLLHWDFQESERDLLRQAEKYLRHWAWQHTRDVSIRVLATPLIEWTLPGRFNASVQYNFPAILPMVLPDEVGGAGQPEEKFIVCAKNPLPPKIYALLEGIGSSNTLKGIVHWQTQKQVVMNAACSQIPIGDSLEECLEWTRSDYIHAPHLNDLEQRSRQELSPDGSNSIEITYDTFDPVGVRVGNPDWIRSTNRLHFIDCGRFGLFQIGESLGFEKISTPAGATP